MGILSSRLISVSYGCLFWDNGWEVLSLARCFSTIKFTAHVTTVPEISSLEAFLICVMLLHGGKLKNNAIGTISMIESWAGRAVLVAARPLRHRAFLFQIRHEFALTADLSFL
jgi:hypothetical protein